MNVDLLRLQNGIDKKVKINETYSFPKEMLEVAGVSKLDDAHIEGEITLDAIGEVYLSLEVSGVMIIPCAITLKPVSYPFDIVIEGPLSEFQDSDEENAKKFVNSLDILPIIWENILVEIPMRVVSDDADPSLMHGDGWCMITDEEEHPNPGLAGLEDLLQDSEVR